MDNYLNILIGYLLQKEILEMYKTLIGIKL